MPDTPLAARVVDAHRDGPAAAAAALLEPFDGAPVTLTLLQVRADRRHASERGRRRNMLALRCWELYQAARDGRRPVDPDAPPIKECDPRRWRMPGAPADGSLPPAVPCSYLCRRCRGNGSRFLHLDELPPGGADDVLQAVREYRTANPDAACLHVARWVAYTFRVRVSSARSNREWWHLTSPAILSPLWAAA